MDSRLLSSMPLRSAGALLPVLVLLGTGVVACASTSSSGEGRRPASGTRISTTLISGLGPTTTLRTVEDLAVFGDTVPYTAGRLWPHLRPVYGELGIEPDIVDPGSYVMSEPVAREHGRLGGERLSRYLRCGRGLTGPNADRYDVDIQVVTQLVPLDADGGTAVISYVGGSARPSGPSTAAIDCTSTGELERRIVNGLLTRTAGGGETTGSP